MLKHSEKNTFNGSLKVKKESKESVEIRLPHIHRINDLLKCKLRLIILYI